MEKDTSNRAFWVSRMEAFTRDAEKFEIHIDPARQEKIRAFLQELLHWNSRFNLTSITKPRDLLTKHVLDSMVPANLVQKGETVVDLGTGAGFPGIPIKILMPELRLILVEATRKKVSFLQAVVRKLDLKDTEVRWARVEDERFLSQIEKDPADVMVTRAALKDADAMNYGYRIIGDTGRIILMKGEVSGKELGNMKKDAESFRMAVQQVVPYKLKGMKKDRNLVVIRKDHSTNTG